MRPSFPGFGSDLIRAAAADGAVLDIVTSRGLLLGTELPEEIMLQDGRMAVLAGQRGGRVLVVPSPDEVAICLRLGFAAVRAAWFADLIIAQLRIIDRLTVFPQPGMPCGADLPCDRGYRV